MFYVVRWLNGSRVVGEEAFEHLLDAKTHARARLHIQKVRKGVTAVEVGDRDGVVYYRFGADGR